MNSAGKIRLKNHWPGLTVFADHPQTPMDNNKAENSHRNPVTGRKNYYGSGAVWSAELAAMLFSILQTVILWGINLSMSTFFDGLSGLFDQID